MIRDEMHHLFDLEVKLNGKECLLQRKAPTTVPTLRGKQAAPEHPRHSSAACTWVGAQYFTSWFCFFSLG